MVDCFTADIVIVYGDWYKKTEKTIQNYLGKHQRLDTSSIRQIARMAEEIQNRLNERRK